MPPADSALDAAEMTKARKLLSRTAVTARMWPLLAAAAFAAVTALLLATAMIIAPPVTTTHMSGDLGGQP